MPVSRHRKQRGMQTQVAVAGYLAENGWPFATDAGPGRPGSDILGVPGLAIEVKARRGLDLPAWLRQAAKAAGANGLPICIHRPDGMGPATVADWPATMRLVDLVTLLRLAGYGDPEVPLPQEGDPSPEGGSDGSGMSVLPR
jgi:hypothetical protein